MVNSAILEEKFFAFQVLEKAERECRELDNQDGALIARLAMDDIANYWANFQVKGLTS